MQSKAFYEFGPYRVDTVQRLLLRDGQIVALTPKTFDLLLTLVESQGQVMSKESLLNLVWPDTFVEETNLTKGVFVLRQALGEGYIETMPRRGYRFNAEVSSAPELGVTQPETAAAKPEALTPKPSRTRWMWSAIAGALGVAAVAVWLGSRSAPNDPIQSMVVLPFVNLSGDVAQEYFSDGLTEEVINALAPIPGLRVVARTSSFQFKGKNEDVRTIGQKLGVDAVLEGSVRSSGNELRVTVQLNDTRTGYHYWSHTWNYGARDVFAVQQQVAREVVQALGRKDVMPVVKPLTRNLAAYDHYLRGAFFAQQVDRKKLKDAVGAFEKALEADPSFAAAHAFIGRCHLRSAVLGTVTAAQAFPLARNSVQKALALDPNLASAFAIQGAINFYSDWDWESAERSFRRAISLNPSDSNSHHEYAHYLLAMRRFEEAFAESQKQIAISPVDREALTHMAFHYGVSGDAPRAIEAAQRALTVDPHSQISLAFLQTAYEHDGQFGKAIDVFSRRAVATPQVVLSLRNAWRENGAAGYWRALHEGTWNAVVPEDLRARSMALYCARVGRKEEMLEWLNKAIELRDTYMVNLNVDPTFAPYRGDPQFQKLVRKVGLPVVGTE